MMWRGISLCLACGLVLLDVCRGAVGADDAALIDPSTTIVTVDGVALSAGLILVPAGKDLEKWWAGEGHDSETQARVRTALDTHSEAAVDTELLRAALASIYERGGAAKVEAFRPTREKYMPIVLSELRQRHHIDEWSQQAPDAKNYISSWLTSRAEARLYSQMLSQVLLERPDQSDTVRAHWAAHRDDFLVMKSARWRQMTVMSEQVKDVERLLQNQVEFDAVVKTKSQDRYREEGGLVESEAPHLFVEDHILVALQGAQPGKVFRVNHEKHVIIVKPETLDRVPGEFHEVAQQVRLDLVRLKSSELAKVIAAKRRAKSRIEWE